MQSIQEVFDAFRAITRLVVFRTKRDDPEFRRNRRWLSKGRTGYWSLSEDQRFDGVALLIDSVDGQSVEVWAADHCGPLPSDGRGMIVGRLDSGPFTNLGRVSKGVSLNDFIGMQLSQVGFNYVEPRKGARRKRLGDAIGAHIRSTEADESPFDLDNIEGEQQKIVRAIRQRRGQRAFRDALVRAYGGKCAITDCAVLDVLEAAHIHPYLGPETNKVSNGLLLRADLHTLFDCKLLRIDPASHTIVITPALRASEYGKLHGRKLRAPQKPSDAPSKKALVSRRKGNAKPR